MSKKYKAVLFAMDGDWVTDYRGCDSIEEVQDYLANQGSRWFFYPIPFVILDKGSLVTSKQRIVDAPEAFIRSCKGKSIGTVSKRFKSLSEKEREDILNW